MTAFGAFAWNELMTRDVAKAKDFYARTLGWTYEDVPMGDMYGTYTLASSNGEQVAGMFEMKGDDFKDTPQCWFAYIAVDDLDERLDKLKEAGGTVLREPFDVEGIGRIAIVADSAGVSQGWMEPADGLDD
jgi:predicted enzyme related to lactoylglutathione lyase